MGNIHFFGSMEVRCVLDRGSMVACMVIDGFCLTIFFFTDAEVSFSLDRSVSRSSHI